MKIIKEGVDISKWSSEVECERCKSELLIDKDDLFITYDSFYSYNTFECLCCRNIQRVSVPFYSNELPGRFMWKLRRFFQ